ncbi:MAG: ribosome silencing factor [Desulfovibrionaceae bacterium]
MELLYTDISSEKRAKEYVIFLEERKAADIVVIDVRANAFLADIIIVATARSLRQGQSIATALLHFSGERKYEYLRMEGYQNGTWILVDFNDIMVHIFQEEERELYRIEYLWEKSKISYDARMGIDELTRS